jgi:hypothetical protein
MLPKARNETEEGLVTGETLVREKTCRIQEAADFLVDSFKELNEEYQNFAATSTATNMRLQAKLAEFQAHTATLQTRNAELRYELEGYKSRLKELEHKVAVASLEKEAGGNQRAKNTKTNRDETITSDEAVLEEYIRRIEDDAASASSTVSLETFRKLHGVYSAIKGALQAKYAKVKKKKTFYKEKYKEQKRDKDAADKEDNPRDNDTAPFQEEREGLRTDKQDIQKIFINRSKSHRPVDQKESPRVEDTANQKGSSRDEDTTPFGKESKILKNYLKELRPRDADAAPSQKSSETPQTELLERVPVATEEIKTEATDKDKANNAEKGDSDPTENEESSSLTIKILKKFCKLPRHDGEDRKLEFCAHWQRSASNEGTTDAETTKKRDSIPFDWVSFYMIIFCFLCHSFHSHPCGGLTHSLAHLRVFIIM